MFDLSQQNRECESLPSPCEIKECYPLSEKSAKWIQRSRLTLQRILDGDDSRLLLIVGPCSIHSITGALDYATKLRALSDAVADKFFIVMRAYYEKPRTCFGWKGLTNDPELNGSNNIEKGIALTRQFLLKLALEEIPVATEILDPMTIPYFEDLITWGCIGARTSESQIHRQMASGLTMPIGFKNNPDGNIHVALRGILSASQPHSFVAMNDLGTICKMKTQGNPHCHLVLRGGEDRPNYKTQDVTGALHLLSQNHLPSRLMIDCSHDNSLKNPLNQPEVFNDAICQVIAGNRSIRGLILESYLKEGNQPHQQQIDPEISITDGCIDWPTTEELIFSAYDRIRKENPLPEESFTCI